jgi:hypothetical protein
MARGAAKTPAEYVASLPADRRAVIAAARKLVHRYIPKGYEETCNWGGITWEIPLSRYPKTYNGRPLAYVSLAARKNYSALYLMGAYAESNAHLLKAAFAKAGKRLDMGRSCLRFKTLADLEVAAVGKVIASFTPKAWIAVMEQSRSWS